MVSIRLFAAAIFSFLSIGQTANTLKDVGSFIQEDPDSALAVLESIDSSKLCTRSLRAQYSLWHTMALDKTTFYVTDENLLRPAVDYYKYHGSKEMRMMSLFYLGRICQNNGDIRRSSTAHRESAELAAKLKTVYWQAMNESSMGDLYNLNYNAADELRACRTALELWEDYGDSTHIMKAKAMLATACHNNRLFAESDSLFLSLCHATPPLYEAYLGLADNEIIKPEPDYGRIVGYYEIAYENDACIQVCDYYQYAYALRKIGEITESDAFLSQLEEYGDSLNQSIWMERIAEDDGDFENALFWEERFSMLEDSLVRKQLRQSIFKADAAYYQLEARIAQSGRLRVLLLLFSSILFFCILFVIMHLWSRAKKAEHLATQERLEMVAEEASRQLKKMEEENDNINKELLGRDSVLEELRKTLLKQYQQAFQSIGALYENAGNVSGIKKIQKENIMRLDSILGEILSDEKARNSFESRLDAELNGIMTKFKTDYPHFSEREYQLVSYLIVGYDSTTRAVLMNSTMNNMRVMKSRVLQEIRSNPTDNYALYKYYLGL